MDLLKKYLYKDQTCKVLLIIRRIIEIQIKIIMR